MLKAINKGVFNLYSNKDAVNYNYLIEKLRIVDPLPIVKNELVEATGGDELFGLASFFVQGTKCDDGCKAYLVFPAASGRTIERV